MTKRIKLLKTKAKATKQTKTRTTQRELRKRTVTTYDINKLIDSPISKSLYKFSPMLAETYTGTEDISNWLMSEKLDGIRCIWNGKNISSRQGNKFYPPKWFLEKFPSDIFLDGELFLERKSFEKTCSIVKKQYEHDEWRQIKYIVFDTPSIKAPFSKRLNFLKTLFEKIDSPFLSLLPQETCKNKESLMKRLDSIVENNGEGVIIRNPQALYENRRVNTMLKVKKFHDDEAIVIKHHKGTGRLAFTMGAIEVKNKSNVIFKIGTGFSDSERSKPPKIGSKITYRYFELTKNGVPRFPSYVRQYEEL